MMNQPKCLLEEYSKLRPDLIKKKTYYSIPVQEISKNGKTTFKNLMVDTDIYKQIKEYSLENNCAIITNSQKQNIFQRFINWVKQLFSKPKSNYKNNYVNLVIKKDKNGRYQVESK